MKGRVWYYSHASQVFYRQMQRIEKLRRKCCAFFIDDASRGDNNRFFKHAMNCRIIFFAVPRHGRGITWEVKKDKPDMLFSNLVASLCRPPRFLLFPRSKLGGCLSFRDSAYALAWMSRLMWTTDQRHHVMCFVRYVKAHYTGYPASATSETSPSYDV